MFGNRRQIRRLAAQVLLAWVFALASGIAHACIVGLESAPAARAQGHGHELAVDDHEHAAGMAASSPCAKFCDDESSVVPASAAAGSVVATFGAWMAPSPQSAWPTFADEAGAAVGGAEPAPEHGRIPIPIAFLRLAL